MKRTFIADPILDPINYGFTDSIMRYRELRNKYPDIHIMMGTGNVTELTHADTTGITMILMGIISELKINHILTTEVSNHCRSVIKENDIARRIILAASENNTTPKIDDLNIETSKYYKVKLKTLDSFNFSRVDLIKIDVEGMELEVLKGSKKILKDLKPIIFYENTKTNSSELKDFLIENNYVVIKEINKNFIAINRDSKINTFFN